MGPAWLVAGPGRRDSLAAAGQEPPVAVLPVAGRVVDASIPLVVPVIVAAVAAAVVVAVAVAAAAPTNPVVVFPTQPEMAVNEPVKKKKIWRTCIASCCACC